MLLKADKRNPNKAKHSQNDICFKLLDYRTLVYFGLKRGLGIKLLKVLLFGKNGSLNATLPVEGTLIFQNVL